MTGEQYLRFDAADHLVDIEDVAGYLRLAIEESAEDPTAVPRALGAMARSGKHERTCQARRHEPRRSLQGPVRPGQAADTS